MGETGPPACIPAPLRKHGDLKAREGLFSHMLSSCSG